MKKTIFAVLLVLLALGTLTGVAGAQASQENMGVLHEYMEKALADKLGITLSAVETQFDGGKPLYQIALDNGIAQADLPAFMLEVRSTAIQAALADGVITQAQADRMLRAGSRGMMRGTGSGTGSCRGTGVPVGGGMRQGRGGGQSNP
jgi:hypothetical protein